MPVKTNGNMDEIFFSKEELERYSRHLIIPEFNIEGQKKLKSARVLIVGTGGLGAPLVLYLAAAGVGTLGLIDFDVVDESNLQRQVLFSTEDIGKPKVEVAKKRIQSLNPLVAVKTYNTRLTSENALGILKDYDIVADGTDNFPTRYLVNDACVLLGITNVYASIFRFDGQVSVFNYLGKDGKRGPDYRDLFPSPPAPGSVPSCAEGGVIGVLPGIVGCLQANEVIKVITGIGEVLSGRLFLFDALKFEPRILRIIKDHSRVPVTGLADYEFFCGNAPAEKVNNKDAKPKEMKEITVHQLFRWKRDNEDIQVIDVREKYEFDISNIGGELIPLKEIEKNIHRISSSRKVIVHCRSGKRSADAIRVLETRHGFVNLYNLKGGILAWADEIDPSMAKY